jgi:hypothetical protein
MHHPPMTGFALKLIKTAVSVLDSSHPAAPARTRQHDHACSDQVADGHRANMVHLWAIG